MDNQEGDLTPDSWNILKRPAENGTSSTPKTLAPAPFADNYKMTHPKRGSAIIFNHVNFQKSTLPKRNGSNLDRDSLLETFEHLGFKVFVHNDLTASEVASILFRVSREDYSDYDCLVIVAMSHGDNGVIYAKDRDYPVKKLWSNFSARDCPTLAGKPKLFFIQACRGTGLHQSKWLTYATTEEDSNAITEASYSIPQMADILVMYSTIEGFYSWRDPNKGSYFIQALVNQLKLHCRSKDLVTILTFVNREVAISFTSNEPNYPKFSGVKQMCSIVSQLTRLVYFFGEY